MFGLEEIKKQNIDAAKEARNRKRREKAAAKRECAKDDCHSEARKK
jgi:hypothetical protein